MSGLVILAIIIGLTVAAKTSGKGHKGQKARSGGSLRLGFEGGQMPLHMRRDGFDPVPEMAALRAAFEADRMPHALALLKGGRRSGVFLLGALRTPRGEAPLQGASP